MNVSVRIVAGVLAVAAIMFALFILFGAIAFGIHWLWKLLGLVAFVFAVLLARMAWTASWPWDRE